MDDRTLLCVCNDQLYVYCMLPLPLPIGMMCQLKDDAYRLLGSLQQSLLTVVNSVGNIEHSVYPNVPSLYYHSAACSNVEGYIIKLS